MTKELPTISVHGKDYVLVKDRILAFHEIYKKGQIHTEVTISGQAVLAKSTVTTDDGRTFTGHSEAVRSASGITGQSPVEVAETSAVGRALGMLGIGILESVASADEIRKAPQSDSEPESSYQSKLATTKQKDFIIKLLKERGEELPEPKWFTNLTMSEAKKTIDKLLKPSMSKEPVIDEDGDSIVNAELAGVDPEMPF